MLKNKIINGKLIASSLLSDVVIPSLALSQIKPKIVAILIGNNEASALYIRKKKNKAFKLGIDFDDYHLDQNVSEDEVLFLITKLNSDSTVSGIIVQLPIPQHLNTDKIIQAVDVKKDVDGFNELNFGRFTRSVNVIGEDFITPCTPLGIWVMLKKICGNLTGSNITIIGQSNLVGKPTAIALLKEGATVTICSKSTTNLAECTMSSDIVVSAAGCPKLLKSNMIKNDAIVIDVGTTSIDDNLFGDCDFDECYDKVKLITPVPGGVGPMTIASIMLNVCLLSTTNKTRIIEKIKGFVL